MIHSNEGIKHLFEKCYKDNLHSLWAAHDLYRAGNEHAEFCNILEENMKPVYDTAMRQGYSLWVV